MQKGEPMEIDNPTKSEISPEESFWWLKFVPEPNVWTNVNIFRFLRLYQTYPLLWDPNNPKYSKSSERSRAYGEISKNLNLQGVHEKECMKLIQSLKKIYIEEKQKKEEAKFSSQKYKPPPVWFQVLNDIVQCIIHNEKEKTSSGFDTNEIKTESIESTEVIKCFKIRRDNVWTPNYFKTDLWREFVPKTSYVTEQEEKENIIINNKDISNESCEALKPSKPNYDSEFQSILENSSLHSSQKEKKYCPDFDNILCDCSSHVSSLQNEKKYCPELKNMLCNCSSDSIQKVKKYCPEFKNILCDCSSKSSQNIKKYCPELKNVVCNCSSKSSQSIKKYCPEFKNILCDCSSKSSQSIKKYCPEFKNIICDCSSKSSQSVKKYCPEFENILCDCSAKSSQSVKKYCPEFENILCDCSAKSSQSVKKYCPEFENILCDCSAKSSQSVKKYCPEFEKIICDCLSETKYSSEIKNLGDYSSKASSDSKITRDSDSEKLKDKIASPFKFAIPTCPVKKYENSYVVDLDRYCSYKDWNKYYNINICGSKEYYEEPLQPEKKIDDLFSNKKPPRFHKNNILESDINLFTEMKRNYEFQLYDCIKKEY